MTQKPGFFKVGDRCRTGAYGWFDNRLYCWRLNWHVPVWKSTIEIDNDFVTAFREGIKEYSFVEVSGLVPLPMFTFRFEEPIGFWHAIVNGQIIHPEHYYEVLKGNRATIQLLLVNNNKVIDTLPIEVGGMIMGKFYKSLSEQIHPPYQQRDFNGAVTLFNQEQKLNQIL